MEDTDRHAWDSVCILPRSFQPHLSPWNLALSSKGSPAFTTVPHLLTIPDCYHHPQVSVGLWHDLHHACGDSQSMSNSTRFISAIVLLAFKFRRSITLQSMEPSFLRSQVIHLVNVCEFILPWSEFDQLKETER